jgi:pyridoxamine 5'-phosphate oxidase family protein
MVYPCSLQKKQSISKASGLHELLRCRQKRCNRTLFLGFDFDGANFYISGRNLLNSTKYKNVMKNNKVSLSIDDLKPGESWEPRGMKIYGTADVTGDHEGYLGRTTYLKITPKKKWSWGIEVPVFVEGKFMVNKANAE